MKTDNKMLMNMGYDYSKHINKQGKLKYVIPENYIEIKPRGGKTFHLHKRTYIVMMQILAFISQFKHGSNCYGTAFFVGEIRYQFAEDRNNTKSSSRWTGSRYKYSPSMWEMYWFGWVTPIPFKYTWTPLCYKIKFKITPKGKKKLNRFVDNFYDSDIWKICNCPEREKKSFYEIYYNKDMFFYKRELERMKKIKIKSMMKTDKSKLIQLKELLA